MSKDDDDSGTIHELRHTLRLASLGSMTAAVAHEINNFLGGILLAAQYAGSALDRDDGRRLIEQSLADIESDARRCSEMLGELQRFARADSAARSPCDANEIIESAIDQALKASPTTDAEVRRTADPAVPTIEANRTALRQALAALIACSLQSGASTVRVAAHHGDEHAVRFTVSDDGDGVVTRVGERLFDPTATFTAGDRAAVLGLSLAHAVAEDHGGELNVASSTRDGHTVTLQLAPAPETAREQCAY